MQKVLSILLINLIFVFVYSQIEDNLDLSNELLNDREIQKYMKSFEKFKRYFRSLDDTSESSEDSEESSGEESTDIEEPGESSDLGSNDESSDLGSNDESSDLGSNDESSDLESNDESSDLESNDESSDIGSNDESSDLGSNDESSDLGSNDESSDLGSNDESSDLGSNDESGEESGEDTSTQTPTQTPPTYSPSTQTPTQTPPTYAPSTQTPTESPTQAPTQTPPAYNTTQPYTPTPSYGYTFIHILLFSNYRIHTYYRPIVITFTLYVVYRGYSPFTTITFTLRLVFILFRGLQESNETYTNTTSACIFDSIDETTGICKYNCSANTEREPSRVESLNDYKFDGQSFELGSNFTISDLALETSKNLIYANSTVSKIISLQNGVVFNNDTSTFSIRGKLKGIDTDTIPFSFLDKSKGENDTTKVNVRCTVINKDEDDFQIKCDPDVDLQTYINGTIGVLDDGETAIYLNMTEFQNYVNIHKSDDNVNNNNNIKYRKNSSGLSGGAIAGIVIACAVILILVSLILMCIRKPKRDENNNSSVVGLRTVDNFTE